MHEHTVLIADIGGTNARFALASGDGSRYNNEINLKCADFADVNLAIEAYLRQVDKPEPERICLAVAGPVIEQQVRLTNNPWFISSEGISAHFSNADVTLLNDFTAIALSLPQLEKGDCEVIGSRPCPGLDTDNYNVAVIGPGTGLGVAGLIRRGAQVIPLTTEAGHMGFAAETPLQLEILDVLGQRYPRISIERLVSGPGLENIHWALNQLESAREPPLQAAQIFETARNEPASLAARAVDIFFQVLGQVAGDVALALGAHQGIYIAGGMVKRYPDMLANSGFRIAFENKGRHQSLMQGIPTGLLTHPQPGLLGCSYATRHLDTWKMN